ncbi:unnamed protein product, partial [Prorocentrum cordatum]
MKLREDAKEGDSVDAARLCSPHLRARKDFIGAQLANAEEGGGRNVLMEYWKEVIMKKELAEMARGARYFRVRVPQGKGSKKSKRVEGRVRLQWAMAASELGGRFDQ